MLKQSRAGNYKFVINLKYYKENYLICPCLTLKQYLKNTEKIRGETKQLFISFQKPYLPVSTSTISRWIKTVMREAGIDVSVFKAHSTRAASSSSARDNDMNVDGIMEIAGWSNSKIFRNYYDKVVLPC